jgi:mannopine transport system substrate-binding protein
MRSKVSLAAAAAAVNGYAAFYAADCDRRRFVVAMTDGIWQQRMRECFFDPFTAATGIEVVTVAGSDSANFALVGQMVRSGQVSIDLYQANAVQSASPEQRTQAEDLSRFLGPFRADPDFMPDAFQSHSVLSAHGATIIAWSRDRLPAGGPTNWAEFWDTRRFPGPRALPDFGDPWRVLAAALLADGVARHALFPLDLDRAFRKLDDIRPHVALWWESGEQCIEGFRRGSYAAGMIWQSRAETLRSEGLPIAWSHDQGFLVSDRWALAKGAPHRDNALRFLEFFLNARAGQARRSETTACVPLRRSALAGVSERTRASLPLADPIARRLVTPDIGWINENRACLRRRWRAWKDSVSCKPNQQKEESRPTRSHL